MGGLCCCCSTNNDKHGSYQEVGRSSPESRPHSTTSPVKSVATPGPAICSTETETLLAAEVHEFSKDKDGSTECSVLVISSVEKQSEPGFSKSHFINMQDAETQAEVSQLGVGTQVDNNILRDAKDVGTQSETSLFQGHATDLKNVGTQCEKDLLRGLVKNVETQADQHLPDLKNVDTQCEKDILKGLVKNVETQADRHLYALKNVDTQTDQRSLSKDHSDDSETEVHAEITFNIPSTSDESQLSAFFKESKHQFQPFQSKHRWKRSTGSKTHMLDEILGVGIREETKGQKKRSERTCRYRCRRCWRTWTSARGYHDLCTKCRGIAIHAKQREETWRRKGRPSLLAEDL